MSVDDRAALETLERRLTTLLPEEYQGAVDTVQPVSMGSADLKYDMDGNVAWNEIWASFCDLAMAGGPPHKGKLLEPASRGEIAAQPERYDRVTQEICRGVMMAAELTAEVSPVPGWIRVECFGEGMAGWLLRAIVMENVAARQDGAALHLPRRRISASRRRSRTSSPSSPRPATTGPATCRARSSGRSPICSWDWPTRRR
jgi:hypothetical protein